MMDPGTSGKVLENLSLPLATLPSSTADLLSRFLSLSSWRIHFFVDRQQERNREIRLGRVHRRSDPESGSTVRFLFDQESRTLRTHPRKREKMLLGATALN